MADAFVEGGPRLLAQLNAIGGPVARKIALNAVKRGAQIELAKAKQLAPVGETGKLASTLKVRAMPRKRGKVGRMVQTGKRSQLGIPEDAKGYYPYAVEFGTGERVQKTTGRRTGQMEATHFLRDAIDMTENQVLQVFASELEKGIREALGRTSA